MKNKKIVIIYHGNCPDGFAGAWAAWKKFRNRAEYLPRYHKSEGKTPNIKGKEVYLIDFTPKPIDVKKLILKNKRVTAIDHHISAEATVKLTQDYSYDVNHSGAVLAWKYFHSRKPVPRLLRHVEDFDLWRFKLPHTKEAGAALGDIPFDFREWDAVIRQFEKFAYRKKFLAKGSVILGHEDKFIKQIAEKNAQQVSFAGYRVLAVNSPTFASQIGNLLAKKRPPFGIVWAIEGKEVKVSLRSAGRVNMAKIAERFGGGGHRNAAGFSLSTGKELPWKVIASRKKF